MTAFYFHCLRAQLAHGTSGLQKLCIAQVLADGLGCEACMARISIASSTHALACALFAVLRPKQRLLVASGPTSGLEAAHKAALLLGSGHGSLADWRISSTSLALQRDGTIDVDALKESVKKRQPHAVLVQRAAAMLVPPQQRSAPGTSIGANTDTSQRPPQAPRQLVTNDQLTQLAEHVKGAAPRCTFIVDNTGCEFIESCEPGSVPGVNVVTGSLQGHVSGGLARSGGYVAGGAQMVERACARMSAPGLSLDAGCVSGDTLRLLFQGMF